jgi:hypothetical protein
MAAVHAKDFSPTILGSLLTIHTVPFLPAVPKSSPTLARSKLFSCLLLIYLGSLIQPVGTDGLASKVPFMSV